MNIEILTPLKNLSFHYRVDGCLATKGDILVRTPRLRVVLPEGTEKPRCHPLKVRAVLLRRYLKNSTKNKYTHKEIDDIFCAALRHDGAKNTRATRVILSILGLLRYQWRYNKETNNAST